MNVMTPELNSAERTAAIAAAAAALRSHKHAGIRPRESTPKKKTAGIRIRDTAHVDDAIAAARSTWPKRREFSIFGADAFNSNAEMGVPPQFNADNSIPNNAGSYDDQWFIDAENGDGCFDGADDYGSFDASPAIELDTPDLDGF